jgi:hypothetical protein
MKLKQIKAYRKELKKAGIKKSERKETVQYLKRVRKVQKKEEKQFNKRAAQQQSAFEQQFANQGAQLNQYLSTIEGQSSAEAERYTSLIARITGQQEQELGALRQQFARQNQESESAIMSLQSYIEKLSRPAAPPKIDVDLRPAVVGISGFQEASQKRQRQGTSGGRRSTKAAPTSAFGLQTAY